MTIVAIRPEPGCSATVAAARQMDLSIVGCPLFDVHPLPWEAPPPEQIDGLLLGSANALRYGGAALETFRNKPVYAVGDATAAAAQAAGLTVAAVGRGHLQPVLDSLHAPLTLLRLTGEEHIALRSRPGITIETRIGYRVVGRPMPERLAGTLRGGALVLLHSAAAARHLAAECDRLAIARAGIALAALSPRVAAAAGGGWRELHSADVPHDAALLALARDMCHEPRPG